MASLIHSVLEERVHKKLYFRYKNIESHARAFLPLNISAAGSVAPKHLSICTPKD